MNRARRLIVSAGATAMIAVLSCGYAAADDSDDDDDDSTRSGSSIETWPPTSVAWPPFSAPRESEPADDNSVTDPG